MRGIVGIAISRYLPQAICKKMVEFAKKLSRDTYFLRVDFFEVDGKVYCGEHTFFENGGWCKFTPEKYDRILGDWIKLPID